MIFFNIGCGILIFSNFMISLIPNKNAIKSSRNPELINKLIIILYLSEILACILGLVGANVYLLPLFLSNNDEWQLLLSPSLFVALLAIAFIRIHFKLIRNNCK